MKKPLRVGFDLDGVLLYNPARLARPIIKFFKHKILHKQKVSFFVPKSKTDVIMWEILHLSSLWPAPGVQQIYRLIDQKQIEAYIITGRFEQLHQNTQQWFNKLNSGHHFSQCFYNTYAEQPHLYKARLIKKLNLDIFIDDNWDIVSYLHHKFHPQTRIMWIYNLFDNHLQYPDKYPTLTRAVDNILE